MWPIKPRKQPQLVNIVLNESTITFSLIQKTNTQHIPHLNIHKSITLPQNVILEGIIYNLNFLKNIILDFLQTYQLENADLALAINAPIMNEQFAKCATIEPNIKNLAQQHQNMVWDYRYLCPAINHDGFVMYSCGIMHEHIFHYQLCALMANAHLVLLTSTTSAYLSLYRHVYGDAFRQSQLSVDLEQHNFTMKNFFTPDILARSLRIPSRTHITHDQDHTNIATAFGLFLTRNSIYGKH